MTYTKERAIELYGESNIQQCPSCEGYYSANSPPKCFACAVGLTDSKGHHPAGVGP